LVARGEQQRKTHIAAAPTVGKLPDFAKIRHDDPRLRGALREARDAAAVMGAFETDPGAGRATG